MSRTQVYARLVFREFHLTFADIAELTDDQISSMLLCERDEHGNVTGPAQEQSTESSFREIAYSIWLLRDSTLTPDQLAERYKQVYGG